MIKRILLFFIVLLLSIFVSNTSLFAQEPPVESSDATFEDVYEQYIDSTDEYNKAHDEYLLRRSQYIKFQSLKSKQDAFDATLLMLQKRDEVVISYLKVLEKRLEDGVGITEDKKAEVNLKIGDEKEWYNYHKDNLSTTGSLDDLVEDSELASDRWELMDPLSYEVMSVLSVGKITKYSGRLDKVFADTKEKLELIRTDEREDYALSSSKLQILDRWVFEADGRIVRSKEKKDEAELLIEEIIKKKKSSPPSVYNNIVNILMQGKLYMNEAISFIGEIVKQIKVEEQSFN